MTTVSFLSNNEWQEIAPEVRKERLNFNKIGQITNEGRWSYFVNGLCYRTQPRLLELVKKINQTLIHLEEGGVKFFDPTLKEVDEKRLEYQRKCRLYLEVIKNVKTHVSKLTSPSQQLKEAYQELEYREAAWQYSLGEENGGLDALKQPAQQWLLQLKQLAYKWKKQQKLAVDQELNELEIQQLEELAKYPEWLKVVCENPPYLNEVFRWCLRDFNPVTAIVKCPETQRCLKVALLSSHLGYVRRVESSPEDEVLSFQNVATKVEGVTKRVLTLAVYHGSFKEFEPALQQRVNILNPKGKIYFQQGRYPLTVKEFLKECAQKNQKEGRISLCADWGLVNFHPIQGMWNEPTGSYNMPIMHAENWTDCVPASRIATHEELVARYGDKVEQRSSFFKVMATRQHLNLNALDCHAWWQLYVRMEDGNWKVLNIGKYAYRFQRGLLDGLFLLCATVKRALCLGDQNGYYAHRQRGGVPVFATEEANKNMFSQIFHMINSSGVFQSLGDNCAYSVQKNTQQCVEGLPNFFSMPMTQARMGIAFVDRFLNWANAQKEWVRWLVVTILHHLLFSFRTLRLQTSSGPVDFSIQKYLKEHGHVIYNPSFLPFQIAKARQTQQGPFADNGELYWSHTDEKIWQYRALTTSSSEDSLSNLQ